MRQIPSASQLAELIDEFAEAMRRERREGRPRAGFLPEAKRMGGVIVAREPARPYGIVGDIHGDYDTLERILAGLDDAKGIVFLGDYVDRGGPEGQVLTIQTVFSLVLEGRAVALRGNHEPPRWLIPHPHDLPLALRRLYGEEGSLLYEKLLSTFDLLPYALVARGAFLALHGGPPTRNLRAGLIEYLGGPSDPPREVLEEILWNDPYEMPYTRAPSPRGAGRLWGYPVTEAALEKAEASIIVRGHEATHGGFKWNHEGRVLTVFSRLGAPYYNSAAAYVRVDACRLAPGAEDCIVVLESV